VLLPVSAGDSDELVVKIAKPSMSSVYHVQRIFVYMTVFEAFGMGAPISYLDGPLNRSPPLGSE
jgi:hypothetical protein